MSKNEELKTLYIDISIQKDKCKKSLKEQIDFISRYATRLNKSQLESIKMNLIQAEKNMLDIVQLEIRINNIIRSSSNE